MIKIDNTLVSLGHCEKCNKPMSANDFVNIAALRLLEPLKYVCVECLEVATTTSKRTSYKAIATTGTVAINNDTTFFNAFIDAQNTEHSCCICGYSSGYESAFTVFMGSVPDSMGKAVQKKFYYCKPCVEKYDLREGN